MILSERLGADPRFSSSLFNSDWDMHLWRQLQEGIPPNMKEHTETNLGAVLSAQNRDLKVYFAFSNSCLMLNPSFVTVVTHLGTTSSS